MQDIGAAEHFWRYHSRGTVSSVRSLPGDSPDAVRRMWHESDGRTRAAVGNAFEIGGLGSKTCKSWPDDRASSLCWVITDMIEQYARHNGRADLLRESLAGQVGE